MTKNASPVRRIVALGVVLVLIAVLHRLSSRDITVLYILWVIAFAFQAFRSVLYLRTAGGKASALTVSLYEKGILKTAWEVLRRRAFHELRLVTLFLIWSLVIFGVVGGIAWTRAMDELEFRFLPTPEYLRNRDTLYNVKILTLVTEDNNPVKYMKNLAQLVDILGKLGARVVIAEQPWMWRNQTGGLLDSIRNMKNVILYESMVGFGKDEYVTTSSPREQKSYAEWQILPSGSLPPSTSEGLGSTIRWYPLMNNGSLFKMDFALAAVGRILGYPDTVKPVAARGHVEFGGMRIPVSADGEALSLRSVRADRAFLDILASREAGADTLSFLTYFQGVDPASPQAREVQGKAIIISWSVYSDINRPVSFYARVSHAGIIESLLRGNVISQYGRFSLPLAAAVIVLSAFLCYRLRLRTSVPIVLVLGIALFLVGVWAATTQLVLLDIAYPTAAALLSAFIFPLVRLSHEHPIQP